MGSTYSVNGYIVTILLRKSPTLLVEGVTDKEAMHRLVAERKLPASHQYLIDQTNIFDDVILRGQGGKSKVLHIKTTVQQLTLQNKKLASRIAFLVDREWEDLPQDPNLALESWTQPQQSPTSFVTFGHSFENYYFHADCFLDYLRFRFAEHFSEDLEESVRRHFNNAIALAGAVSYKAKDKQCLTKLDGMIKSIHIELSQSGRFYLSDKVVTELAKRCQIDATSFVADVNASIDSYWSALSQNQNSRWVLHGHVGTDVLWACVGIAATFAGVKASIGEEIALSYKNERRRCCFTWLSRGSAELRAPLDQAVDWLLSPLPLDG